MSRSVSRLNSELVVAVFHENERALRGFVASRVPSGEVDDVLQIAALRAWEWSGSLNDPDRALAWLYRILRNVIVDEHRRTVSRSNLLNNVAGMSWELPTAVDLCGCSLVLARGMRPAYSAILALVDAGGATVADAADMLGISPNNAAVRLHRARKALRKTMRDHCGVETPGDCIGCRCVSDGCCV